MSEYSTQRSPKNAAALTLWTTCFCVSALLVSITIARIVVLAEWPGLSQIASGAVFLFVTLILSWLARAEIPAEISSWRSGIEKYIHDRLARRAERTGTSFEETKAALLAALQAAFKGCVFGVGGLLACKAAGAIPQNIGDSFLIPFGGLVGACFGWQLATKRYPKPLDYSDMSFGGDFGTGLGAAIAVAAAVVWNAVINGLYDPDVTWKALVFGGFVGAPTGLWWGAARSGMFRRTRLVLSSLLSACAGLYLIRLSLWEFPAFWQSVANTVPEAFADRERGYRIVLAIGVALGLASWAWWNFSPSIPTKKRNKSLPGTGELVDGINDLIRRFILGSGAIIRLAIAGAIAWYAWSDWAGLNLIACILWLVAVVVAWSSVSDLRETFRGQPGMKNLNPHGNADLATERRASDYETGAGGRTTVHDQRF
jgi:hypothetical protein